MRKAFFFHKDIPVLSFLISICARKNKLNAFLLLINIHSLFARGKHSSFKKNAIIRFSLFCSLYYDNSQFFLAAHSLSSGMQGEDNTRTLFSLFFHFEDEFPLLTSPPYDVFRVVNQRLPQSTRAYTRLFLNKFATVSKNLKKNSQYFKYLFDVAIHYELIDKVFINSLIWSSVINRKERIFDMMDKDGFVYNPPDDEGSDLEFAKKLIAMKGKDPYTYMSYCNPHYQRFCLLLLV